MTIRDLPRPVVVATDGSASATEAVRWAARAAVRRGLPLRVLHVLDRPTDDEVLVDARDAAVAAAPGVCVSETGVPGATGVVVVDWSRGAELLVLGSRGRGASLGLGSVALTAVAHAFCSVVVVSKPAPDGPVVLGVDGSALSEAATGFAFAAAELDDAPLLAVHGWHQPTWETLHEAGYASARLDALAAEAGAMVADRLAVWRDKHPGVRVTQLVVRGAAADALVAQSRSARLVVVGGHGRGPLAGLVLGSTSRAVLRHATCPVAVVRERPSHGE